MAADERERAELDRTKRLFELLYPGLIAQMEACGAGHFRNDYPPKVKPRGDNDFKMIHVAIRYEFDDGMLLRIESRNQLNGRRPNYIIERTLSVYHCGPDRGDITATHFRICINTQEPPHVHLPGDDHIPIDKVSPNVRDRDPREFVNMVEEFRRTGNLPLRRTRP